MRKRSLCHFAALAIAMTIVPAQSWAEAKDVSGGTRVRLATSGLDITMPGTGTWRVEVSTHGQAVYDKVGRLDHIAERGLLEFELRRVSGKDCVEWVQQHAPANAIEAGTRVQGRSYWPNTMHVFELVKKRGMEAVGCVPLVTGGVLEVVMTYASGSSAPPGEQDSELARALITAVVDAAGGAGAPQDLGQVTRAASDTPAMMAPDANGTLVMAGSVLAPKVPSEPDGASWVAYRRRPGGKFEDLDVVVRVPAGQSAPTLDAAEIVVEVPRNWSPLSCALMAAELVVRRDATLEANPFTGGPWWPKAIVAKPEVRPTGTWRTTRLCVDTKRGGAIVDINHRVAPSVEQYGTMLNVLGDALLKKHGVIDTAERLSAGRYTIAVPSRSWRVLERGDTRIMFPTGPDAQPVAFAISLGILPCDKLDKLSPFDSKGAWIPAGWFSRGRIVTDKDFTSHVACLEVRGGTILAAALSLGALSAEQERFVERTFDHIERELPDPTRALIAPSLELGQVSPDGMGLSSATSFMYAQYNTIVSGGGLGPAVLVRNALGYADGFTFDLDLSAGVSYRSGAVTVAGAGGFGFDRPLVAREMDDKLGAGAFVTARGFAMFELDKLALSGSFAICPRTGPNETRLYLGAVVRRKRNGLGLRVGMTRIDYADVGSYLGVAIGIE